METASLIQKIRNKQPKEYYDLREISFRQKLEFALPFMHDLSQSVSGFSGETYKARNNKEALQNFIEMSKNNYCKIIDARVGFYPEMISQKTKDLLLKIFKDELVIDIGCGINGDGYALADFLGASGYIGVESEFACSAHKSCKDIRGQTPFVIVQQGLMNFLYYFSIENIKAKVILFSGVEDTSYKEDLCLRTPPYEEIFRYMAGSLKENGQIIIGGNGIKRYVIEKINKKFRKECQLETNERVKLGGFHLYSKIK